MSKISFQEIDQEVQMLLSQQSNELIQRLYSNFHFIFFSYYHISNKTNNINFIQDKDQFETFLLDYLEDAKFLTYHINHGSEIAQPLFGTSTQRKNDDSENLIICFEGKCLIFEQMNIEKILKIITILKEKKAIINTNQSEETYRNAYVNEEIINFCMHFNKEITNNIFFRSTLKPIAGFLIRRYFYPSSYFKDPSFFNFDKQDHEASEMKIKNKLSSILLSDFKDKKSFNKKLNEIFSDTIAIKQEKETHIHHEFHERDFIILRIMYSNSHSMLYLAIHIHSLKIFCVKKIDRKEIITSHETQFCSRYSHRCLTRFYGFIKKGESIIGFVYEFMCNGSLNHYNYRNNDKSDELFGIMTTMRICQAIEYLHANELIHRDIKPSNILIDHDNLPYLSDFETIRRSFHGDEIHEFTNDIASALYSSPEQDHGVIISYPSDIYSYGLLIYYIFEKKDIMRYNFNYRDKKNLVDTIINFSNTGLTNICEICKSCLYDMPEKRASIKMIKNKLIDELNSFKSVVNYLYKNDNCVNELIISFLYEYILIQHDKPEKMSIVFTNISILHALLNIKDYNFGQLYKYNQKDDFTILNNYFLKSKESNPSTIFDLGLYFFHHAGFEKNYEVAKKLFELSAKFNYSDAIYSLGYLYYKGFGVEKNYSEAKKYFELAAKSNNSKSLISLGIIYGYGKGVKRDFSKAKEYFEKAAEQNNYNSYYYLGCIYENGLGTEQNYEKAIKYFEISAQEKNSSALLALGRLYLNGQYVKQDYSKAIEYFQLSAKESNSYGYFSLGELYEYGKGVKKDYSKAKYYYELSIMNKNSDALLSLGNLYENGLGVERNLEKAIEYYKLSAKENNSSAYLFLGNIYFSNLLNKKNNYQKAKKYYEISAELNNSSALNNLGNCYMTGIGGCKDYTKAKYFYDLAAKQNNSSALFNLGNMYKKGNGVKKDFVKSKQYYELAAKLNNSEALNNLGYLYTYGYGVKKNISEAIKCYESAAKLNNSDALINLGLLYINGYGIKKDISRAINYLELAAEQKNSDAFLVLGNFYSKDKDKKDYEKARKYYELSAKQYNSSAINNLGIFYYNGYGVEQSYLKAKQYFEYSYFFNNSSASNNLGIMYLYGYGVQKDYTKAKQYFEKSAQQKNSAALNNLGILYSKGYGVEQNLNNAIFYFGKSAIQGNLIAFNNIGLFYLNSTQPDFEKAKIYFQFSALAKNSNALNNLGIIYINGFGVKKDYNKAIEYFKQSALQHNSAALNNLGLIFLNGYGVPKDDLLAIHYFELSSKQYNSYAFLYLGLMHKNGLGIQQDFSEAKFFFEKSARLNNSDAFYELGCLYYEGQGVNQDYYIARCYYELAAQFHNSDALFKIGYLYYKGYGVLQDYYRAKLYFKLAAQYHNPNALFYLGIMHSNKDYEIYYVKAINYFLECTKVQHEFQIVYNDFDESYSFKYIYNEYVYLSYNELGLIYILYLNDENKAVNYIKESAFAEYPYGQNNFGLLLQFYLNNIGNAQYMYERASKHKFSLAEYNLGHLYELNEKEKESIEYYIKASDDEESLLTYRNCTISDTRLEISKYFIICCTNLKLSKYYFSLQNYDESKQYFTRAFSKLKFNEDHKTQYKIDNKYIFEFIYSFILRSPLFNLVNQPNLNSETLKTLKSNKLILNIQKDSKLNENKSTEINKELIDKVNDNYALEQENKQEIIEDFKEDFSEETTEPILTFENPDQLFNLILSNNELNNKFITEIDKIIRLMDEIIYTPPYSILFGRIYLSKQTKKSYNTLRDINRYFYEGLGDI